ncbi:MAG: DUF1858 domain-containing protein [Lacrimispora sp.]
MNKTIDGKRPVYELVTEYPEIKDILFELGFEDIIKPGMLQTAGRFMTIPKGAAMKKIDMTKIEEVFREKGFLFSVEN